MCNKFEDYKSFLLNDEIILKLQQRFQSKAHNVYTEKISKMVFSSNNDKSLQTFDKITSYPYDASLGKVCQTELPEYLNTKCLVLVIMQMKT